MSSGKSGINIDARKCVEYRRKMVGIRTENISALAKELLLEARKQIDLGDSIRAEALIRSGMVLYHNECEHGSPLFDSELLRMLLNQHRWGEAEGLIPKLCPPGGDGDRWWEPLFARAYLAAGDIGGATVWWSKVREWHPGSEEANIFFAKEGAFANVREADHRDAVSSVRADLLDLKQTIFRGVAQTHPFFNAFIKFKNLGIDEAVAKYEELVNEADSKLAGILEGRSVLPKSQQVPKILHKIWLTKENCPYEPPEVYIDQLIKSANEAETTGWRLMFWTQAEDYIPNVIARLKSEIKSVEIMSVYNDLPDGHWLQIFSAFLRDNKYPFAVDVLRMKVLFEYGGLYADMGARFASQAVCDAVASNFRYALIYWENMFFQNSLMLMPKGSELGGAFMRVMEDPYIFPEELLGSLTGLTEGYICSGLLITALLLCLPLSDGELCPLAPNMRAVSWSSQQSWYTTTEDGSTKFGNNYVPNSEPSFLRKEGWIDRKTTIFDMMNFNYSPKET